MLALLFSLFIEEPFKPSLQYSESIIIEQYIPEPPQEVVELPPVIIEEEVEEIPCEGIYCSCMVYLQIEKNLVLYGDAIDQVPNKPLEDIEQGDVILIDYGDVGHSAYVEYRFPGAVWVSEANYRTGEYSERAIDLSDPRIRGAMSVKLRE